MQLQFHHRGRQFFFITLALEGRVPALSRLVDEVSPPQLYPAGEDVLAILLAIHKVFPCATLSNRVIMPDHVHFLLIVDYDRMPTFNPLWVSFIVMEAIEAAWNLKERGQAPAPPFNAVEILSATVAKGRETAGAIKKLQRAQNCSREEALAQLATQLSHAASPTLQGRGGAAPVRSVLRFERRAYIELSFDSRQLKAIRHYIKYNPGRALWKLAHRDRFVRFANIRHAILDSARAWQAMGNLTLLGSPFLFHVRLTLKKSLAEHEAAICEILSKAKCGMIPVSGFISPGEVELLRRLKATPGTRFIKMLPCSLPPRYDPSVEDSRELATDRLLILSGFTNTHHVSALAMHRDPAAAHLFRANCLIMNELAATLCAKAQERC